MIPARSVRRVAVAAGAIVAAGLVWTGCSVEKNYDVLSFFFDGVPDPNALPVTSTAGGDFATMRESATYTIHRPFAEEKCDACHRSMFDRTSITSAVCVECHTDIQDQYEFMHGPVAVGACLWCHVPHESAFSHLLKAPDRSLCMQCHRPELLPSEDVPEHADEAMNCLDCHYGHGSDARYQLKDRPSLSEPAGEG